jgi:DNA topoisomerase-1
MELGLTCPRPGCGGNLVTKRAKRRRFIGCDKYPACDFAVFGRPDTKVACPTCGNTWTVTISSRKGTSTRRCPVPGCDYVQNLTDEAEC